MPSSAFPSEKGAERHVEPLCVCVWSQHDAQGDSLLMIVDLVDRETERFKTFEKQLLWLLTMVPFMELQLQGQGPG